MINSRKLVTHLALTLYVLASISAQADQVTITNVDTGMALEVQRASAEPNAIIQQHPVGKTKAQAFNHMGVSTEGISVFRTLMGEGLLLGAETRIEIENQASADENTIIIPAIFQRKGILLTGTQFTNIFDLQQAQKRVRYQRWVLISVEGAPNTYNIRNVAYGDGYLVAPLNPAETSALALVPASEAKHLRWRVEPIKPQPPSSLERSKVTYSNGKVETRLNWEDQSTSEDKFRITVRRKDDDKMDSVDVSKNRESANVSFDLGSASKDRSHCFIVASIREHYQVFSSPSDEVCGVAIPEDIGDPEDNGDTPVFPKNKCGIGNCPSGYHEREFFIDSQCGHGSSKNATRCFPNTGQSFLFCSTGICPDGYERKSLKRTEKCDSDGGLFSENAQICVKSD